MNARTVDTSGPPREVVEVFRLRIHIAQLWRRNLDIEHVDHMAGHLDDDGEL